MKYTANAFSLPSSDGIHTLAAWCWTPENPVGVIQLSHGMCEYILRYTDFAERMCDAGFAVVGHDHLGHGYTARNADELGYMTDAKDPARCLVKDVYAVNSWIKSTFPSLPIILYGHSMGSFIARWALTEYKDAWNAAVISGTAGSEAPTGAGKLLGINMGDNVEVIAKLQAAMGVMNSLTTIQNALQKQSALMMGLSAIKAKLLSGELTASVAAKALNVALKGLGIGLAIAAITTLIDKLGLFSSESDSASDATDRFNDSLQKMDNKVKDLETSFKNLISYMQQIGSSSEVIDGLRKQAADEEVALAVAEYNKLFNGGMGGVFGKAMTSINQSVIPQSVQQQALDKVTAARQRQASVYAEIGNKQKAGDFFNSNWNTLNTEKEINAAIGYFRNLRSELEKGSTEYAEMTKRIDTLQAKLTTGGGGGGGGRGGAASLAPQYSVAGLTEDLKYLQQEQQKATNPEEWRTYADAIRAVEDEIRKVKGELSSNGLDTTTGGISISGILSDKVRSDQASYRKQKIEVHDPVGEKEKVDTTQKVGELVSSVGSIVTSLNQLGIEIPKGFSDLLGGMQAVITILEAIQTIQYVGSILGIFHNGGIVPHAASGYMVPGTHYSNDVTPVLANAGELILSKSQQGNLASQLSAPQGGYAAQPYVNGEMILLGTNNYLGRSGQGEIVTTKMLKGLMK